MLAWFPSSFLVLIGIVFWFLHVLLCLFHQDRSFLLMNLLHSRKGFCFLVGLQLLVVGVCGFWFCRGGYFIFILSLCGPCSFRHGYVVTEVWLITFIWHSLLLCPCTQAGDHWQVDGCSKITPFLTPIFPSGILVCQRARRVIESQRCIPIFWCSLPRKVVNIFDCDLVASIF